MSLNLFSLGLKVLHRFTITDITIAKLDLIVVGLLLANLFPTLTSLHRGRYVAFIVLCEIYFIVRIKQIGVLKSTKTNSYDHMQHQQQQ